MAKILEWEYTQPGYLEKTKQIDVKEDAEKLDLIAERLKNALNQEKDLLYATANQVGYDYSVFALRQGDECLVFANPLMSVEGDLFLAREKEYGLKNDYIFLRKSILHLIAYSYEKKLVVGRDFDDKVAASVLQHIQNNLDGISIRDIGLEVTKEFDEASIEEQNEVITEYVNQLDALLSSLESDIEEDSEVSKMYDAYKFLKAKAAGDIEASRPVKQNRKMRRMLDKIAGKFKRKKK